MHPLLVESEYEIRQTVYLVTDKQQEPRLITGILVRDGGRITYEVSCGTNCSWHAGYEIAPEVNVLLSSTN